MSGFSLFSIYLKRDSGSPLPSAQKDVFRGLCRSVCSSLTLMSVVAVFSVFAMTSTAQAQTTTATAPQAAKPAPTIAELLKDATAVGEGIVQVYELDGRTLITLDPRVFGVLFHWYVEAIEQPPQIISHNGNAIGETVMRLEKRGGKVYIRDLLSAFDKRAAQSPTTPDEPGGGNSELKLTPIELSLAEAGLGTIVLGLKILAEDEDGTVLLDLTPVFSNDLGGSISVLKYLAQAGQVFAAVDPNRSYIESARSFGTSVNIRSHLTFASPTGASTSIVVGHSLSALPLDPMPAREFDKRVGYFATEFAVYGGADAVRDQTQIVRHRLERPAGAGDGLTDPVEPIVYYIGRSVPDRWRPYIKAGVESWQSAFEEAGFSNAIVARDAPSVAEDPSWFPEDTNKNVIRWIAQPFENAMGPFTYDPRTGEILGAHILLWPKVLDFFSAYYFALHSSVDPEAATFPLSDQKVGELLTYILAHEVGHTLGLRHNHLASTAYTVDELRDPDFANASGPNASIMAYGRFNQAAQPGDGVTRFLPDIGPYDKFAIKWGYSQFPDATDADISATLDEWAGQAARDRLRRWSAGEAPNEYRQKFDPRVQMENTGSDRIAATRLGIQRLSATIASLPGATGGDLDSTRTVYSQAMNTHTGFLTSVASLIGGIEEDLDGDTRYRFTPKSEQRRAVQYLLGDGSETLEIYARRSLLRNLEAVGGLRQIDAQRELIMYSLMAGPKLALLEMQSRFDPDGYNVPSYANDIVQALFGTLESPSRGQQVLQVAFLDQTQQILTAPPTRNQVPAFYAELLGLGIPNEMQIRLATGGGTAFPGWARQELPLLAKRLDVAAQGSSDEVVSLHYRTLAARMRELANLPIVQQPTAAKE